jgi:hypothetical protein
MKKIGVLLLALGVVTAVAVPSASAWGGGGHGFRHGGGCFGCGFVGGLVLGGVLSAPYSFYAPPLVYVAPAPVCTTRQGYWAPVPFTNHGRYTYRNVWVPQQTVCR